MDERYFLRNNPLVTMRILNASVVILGLGGLGSNVAVMLARVGVGNLTLVDYDRVEYSNLNRQHYNYSHIGKLKTLALEEQLRLINPTTTLKIINLKLTKENLGIVLKDESIICEAFDNPQNKAIIADYAALNLDKKFIFGNGMGGYKSLNLMKVCKFGSNSYICGDCKYDEFLMAPKVMMCAAMQANTIVNIIMEEFEL